MIKNLFNLTKKDFTKILDKEISIYEKLDMIYFKISVTRNGVFSLRRPRYLAISDIDCICNSVYKDIMTFTNDSIYPIKDRILEKFGELTIGVFYLPVHKTKMIDYDTMPEKTFILSDVNKNVDLNEVREMIGPIKIHKTPLLFKGVLDSSLKEELLDIFDNKDSVSLAKSFLKTCANETFSMLDISRIEGLIIKTNSKNFQIIINDTYPNIDKNITKPYRDILLQNLSKLLDHDILNELADKKYTSYLDRVTKLFKHFLNNTDIFSKYKLEASDLMPPICGYFGDLDLSKINDDEVKSACTVSKLCRNIFRIFLHTFTNSLSYDKFKDLPETERLKLNNLIEILKYKNYAEITKNL